MNFENSENNKLDIESEYSDEDYDSDDEEEISEEETEIIDEEINVIGTDGIEGTEIFKKKRGRKCKPKDENVQIEKVQKKRGRKPKVKDLEEVEKTPKKRGRKPKEKIYSVKELPKTFFEENKNETFILHLPIKTSEQNNEYIPIANNNDNYSIYNDVDNYKVSENNLLLTQVNLMDSNEIVNDNNKYVSFNSNDKYVSFNSNDNNKYVSLNTNDNKYVSLNTNDNKHVSLNTNDNKYVSLNTNDNKYVSLNKEDDKTNKVIKKNLKNIMYEFINANNDKTWPESTSIYCWWCCHPFTCTPCAIPEYYKKEKFYVNGCFCSFNCAASYNFSKNDDNMWERYSLLNLMYKKLYDNKFVKINLAPPREILKIFGGYMSIEEFRENSYKNEKIFSVVKPPLISIIPKIEENISNNQKNIKVNFPLVNENILNKTQNNLKLKRNKPVTNPNSTLQSFMDLKIM